MYLLRTNSTWFSEISRSNEQCILFPQSNDWGIFLFDLRAATIEYAAVTLNPFRRDAASDQSKAPEEPIVTSRDIQNFPPIGWRERVALPELGIAQIKAKIDTGARSSALHAFNLEEFDRDGKPWVRFQVHPLQRDDSQTITAVAPIFDRREVRNSGGEAQLRPFIRTLVQLGDRFSEKQWPIELTLTDRSLMGFRMLLGREAVRQRFLVDPGRSFLWSPTNDDPVELENEEELR